MGRSSDQRRLYEVPDPELGHSSVPDHRRYQDGVLHPGWLLAQMPVTRDAPVKVCQTPKACSREVHFRVTGVEGQFRSERIPGHLAAGYVSAGNLEPFHQVHGLSLVRAN